MKLMVINKGCFFPERIPFKYAIHMGYDEYMK